MKNWAMRIFSLMGLLLISSAAFADNSTADAVSNHTDLSISFLAQIFGTVGNSLQGTTGQMLGMLFYKFNQGILVVAGVWLSYLVLTTFLKSAHEGSFINPNRNIVIILLRVALGFGLLLPNPVTGYSIFQDIIMKVVVAGVSLADNTWSYGLQYINDGGQVWSDPAKADMGYSLLSFPQAKKILGPSTFGSNPTFSDLGVGQQIFIDEVCMYSAGGLSASVIEDDKNGQFIFPGATQSGSVGCGSAKWYNAKNTTTQNGFAQQGTNALVYDMLPAARSFICSTSPTTAGCSGMSGDRSADIGNAFFNALLGYANAAMPATQQTGDAAQNSRAFIEQAKKDGWMLAGRYYWDLSQAISNFQANSDVSSFVPFVAQPPLLPPPGQRGQNQQVADTLNTAFGLVGGYTASAMTLLSNYTQASQDGGSSQNVYSLGASNTNVLDNMPSALSSLLWPYIDSLNGIVNNFSVSKDSGYSYDPIVFLHNIGMRCLNTAGAIWITTSIVFMALSATTIFCQSVVNLDSIYQALVGWIKPFMMVIAVAFLGVGIMLGYYVPMYPYMIFTFAVIGWMIRVLVGMAAAPLVCLSLTHPEGHDFLGIAQQLLQLLLSLFIEPVLLIIGLFAGMIFSYVSLRILVYTFSGFISDLFWQKSPIGDQTPALLHGALIGAGNYIAQNNGGPFVYLSFPIILIIFAAIVYMVTNKCFSVIFELPGAVMQWIGGPSMQHSAGEMANQVGGIAGRAGQTMGQGLQQIDLAGAGKAAGENARKGYDKAKAARAARNQNVVDINDVD